MKIFVGCFYHEATTFNPFKTKISDFTFVEGEKSLERFASTDIFREEGIEIIPSIYATAISSGILTYETYRFFADKIIGKLKEAKEIDGIWLHLHGSMEVEDVGSGELALLKEMREVCGYDIPISLTLDFHANLKNEFHQYVNIVRSYRTVPHVDQAETEQITAKLLIDCIKNKAKIRPSFTRVPLIFPGEKVMGDAEPLKSIFKKLEKIEQMDGIISANYFNGHAWNDTINTSASVLVVPESEEYEELAENWTKKIADYVFSRRHEFQYNVTALDTDEAINRALNEKDKPVFIADSGDNTTGGAPGINTLLLKRFKGLEINNKKILISAIFDVKSFEKLNQYNVGDLVSEHVGVDYDENSSPVLLEGELISKGDLLGFMSSANDKVGEVCVVSTGNIDVVVANRGDSFTTLNHFKRAGLNIDNYDIIVVKQGYLFDELSDIAKIEILALTPGATDQRIEELEFHNIIRPVFPIDNL